MRKIFLIIIFIIFALPIMLHAAEKGDEIFFRANQLYREGKFIEALDDYQKLVDAGHASGHLYYNMGNACFRLNRLGHAILYYEKARILLPRDADLDYNLRHVRNLTKDVIEESQGILSMTFFWLDSITLSEVFWIFIIINIVFWVMLIIRIYIKEEWTYYIVIIFLVAWFISGASFAKKFYDIETDDRGVILADEVEVLSGPEAGDTVLFKLHAGAIVHYEREEDGWRLIGLPDRKRGWIRSGALELVR